MLTFSKKQLQYLCAGTIIFFYFLLLSNSLFAQNDKGYIYGEVTSIDGNKYKGAIRWGKEETFWNDIFNSSKGKNPNLKYLNRGDYSNVRNDKKEHSKWDFWHIWDDSYSSFSHSFAIRFGDIRSILMTGRESVEVEFKNGSKWALEGGSNDIGAKINVFDQEIGEIEINWNRIERVDFMITPKNLKFKFGEPLYGTVVTKSGNLTGMIQWDHEECLTTDRLDGDTEDGDISIPFGNIQAIENRGRGSLVRFKSGKELLIRGTNDVNSDNRGIIVKNPEYGKVKIGWKSFEKVTFTEKNITSGPGYQSFESPKELRGVVKTIQGDSYRGRLVYDLDEEWDFELLNGSDEAIDYIIPFRMVKSIKPKNFNFSTVKFLNGKELLLGYGQDVSDKHDGMLIFNDSKEGPVYVPWSDVEEVIFD